MTVCVRLDAEGDFEDARVLRALLDFICRNVGGVVQICHNLGNNIILGERLVHDAVVSH